RYGSLCQGRNLFVIHDERDGLTAAAWPSFLHSTLRTPLPHALLLVGEGESSAVQGIGLPPVGVDELIAAVYPQSLAPRVEQKVRRAAMASRGLPGRFARLLWPDWIGHPAGSKRASALRAAEGAAAYGTDEQVDHERARIVVPTAGDTWPAPGELAALRNRVAAANGQLASGRHAPALRQLRQASSALARRDAWSDAAAAAVTVAAGLLG